MGAVELETDGPLRDADCSCDGLRVALFEDDSSRVGLTVPSAEFDALMTSLSEAEEDIVGVGVAIKERVAVSETVGESVLLNEKVVETDRETLSVALRSRDSEAVVERLCVGADEKEPVRL